MNIVILTALPLEEQAVVRAIRTAAGSRPSTAVHLGSPYSTSGPLQSSQARS